MMIRRKTEYKTSETCPERELLLHFGVFPFIFRSRFSSGGEINWWGGAAAVCESSGNKDGTEQCRRHATRKYILIPPFAWRLTFTHPLTPRPCRLGRGRFSPALRQSHSHQELVVTGNWAGAPAIEISRRVDALDGRERVQP